MLSLLYRDGKTLREAGRVMRLDFSTVSRRAKAARAALRKRIEALAAERMGLRPREVAELFGEGADAAVFSPAEADA